MTARPPLTRERIVDAAAAVADRLGLEGVSMRSVGRELGAEAMSLYHHIAGKESLLDDLADWVFARIDLVDSQEPWRDALALRASSMRVVLAAHPWSLRLVDARRASGPAQLRHQDAVLGCLFGAGFPTDLAVHAVSATDSYVYGFVLTELNLPFKPGESAEELVADLELPLAEFPHLARMVADMVVGRDFRFADEFSYGLDLILDGLAERLRDRR
ncbi:MAG: TetR/AcrR family transcriptional regulator C-terminal domain-containing protein [Propionibacteriaceae bacterium]|jgi:AcrR family transcriptional regulator|nr:TetR/AcrR family transcriptional regulator C-terminal domain-containing protein [Propionibacteriaceae bacterium]